MRWESCTYSLRKFGLVRQISSNVYQFIPAAIDLIQTLLAAGCTVSFAFKTPCIAMNANSALKGVAEVIESGLIKIIGALPLSFRQRHFAEFFNGRFALYRLSCCGLSLHFRRIIRAAVGAQAASSHGKAGAAD